jgi:protein-tyrosine phosphatase
MMVDFHMHLLPEADHGSQTVDESILMIEDAKKCGINAIVATPHYYPENEHLDRFIERREKSFLKLMSGMPENLKDMTIIKAAEVLLSPKLNLDDIGNLRIGDSSYILMEMPYVFWTEWVFNKVFEIISQYNLTPVIAHVERFRPYQMKTNNIERLLQMEVIPQFNAGSICRWPKNRSVMKLIKNSEKFFLGSDRHSSKDKYKIPQAISKISRKCGEKTITNLKVNSNDIFKYIP